MLVAGLVCQLVADTIRAPRMLVLLLGGTLLGSSVTGAIDVPLDSTGAELLLTLGVSFILFYGGLQLSVGVLSRVAVGLGLLAVPGRRDHRARDRYGRVDRLRHPVLDGAAHRRRRRAHRSGDPDPALRAHRDSPEDRADGHRGVGAERRHRAPSSRSCSPASSRAAMPRCPGRSSTSCKDLGISTVLGIGFGILLSLVVSDRRAGVWKESAAIAVVAVVAVGYFSTDSAGGSGYLGAFLAGLIVGNMDRLGSGCTRTTSGTCAPSSRRSRRSS